MNFKSIGCTSGYIFFPPLIIIRSSILPRDIPIISGTIALSYPRCINAAAARAFPSLFCFRLSIWAVPSCTCARPCGAFSDVYFICSYHIYLQSDVYSSLFSVPNSFSCSLIKAIASSMLLTRMPPCLIKPVTYRF